MPILITGRFCPESCSCGRHKGHPAWNKGRPAWNRGLSEGTHPKKCLDNCLCGKHRPHWSKGLTKESDSRLAAIVATTWTEEKRRQFTSTMTAVWSNPLLLQKRCETNLLRYGRVDGPTKDTKPEKLIEAELISLNLRYEKQIHKEGISVDFYLPGTKTVIFVDGCYWHFCKDCFPSSERMLRRHEKDAWTTNRLLNKGYKVLRIQEHELYGNKFSGRRVADRDSSGSGHHVQ